jgi:hypothetical protein
MVSKLKQPMISAKKPAASVRPPAETQSSVEEDLVAWMKGTVHTCQELVSVLERLRNSYKAILTESVASDADEILTNVEEALRNAKNVRDLV